LSPPKPRASLIYNPNAGRRRHARALTAIRSALGQAYELGVAATEAPGDAILLAREAATRGDEAVFAWGGDGTVREVVEGILGSPAALGVLPGGTFNVVARALGLSRDPARAAVALTTSAPSARDVGVVNDTPFIMQAMAGLEGFIMHHLRADLKARFGYAGVAFDGLRAFSRYRFEPFAVDVDGERHEVTGASFVNMTEYAGPYHFVPGARWDDGKAHALLFTGKTHLSALMFTLSIGLGRHHRRPDVLIREAAQMTIHAGPSVRVQTDGDPWRGSLPATCRLADHRIQVLIPRGV
jgi:YegS/Rv2252/BmrU family lipid kinase